MAKVEPVKTYRTPDELVDLLDTVLSEAEVRHFDSKSDETLTECLVCGEWEGHTDLCPVPAIQKWMKS